MDVRLEFHVKSGSLDTIRQNVASHSFDYKALPPTHCSVFGHFLLSEIQYGGCQTGHNYNSINVQYSRKISKPFTNVFGC
jgi:hypothetical protein